MVVTLLVTVTTPVDWVSCWGSTLNTWLVDGAMVAEMAAAGAPSAVMLASEMVTVFVAGIPADSAQPVLAGALIESLRTPEAKALFRAKDNRG